MKIVCIGGGHGLSQVLKALKGSEHNLTAIITTTDNGGSTGRLRNNTSQIAYGDIRRCISVLATEQNILADVSELRFESNNELKAHCLGNILLSALDQQFQTPSLAIDQYCQLLGVTQQILPMSDTVTDLVAEDSNGELIFGEVQVEQLVDLPQQLFLSKKVKAPKRALDAILTADLVLIGPGSLITSVMPPLMMEDIRNALINSRGCRVYIENLVPENGVMGQLPLALQSAWACQMLGYRFFDISLSRDALMLLTEVNIMRSHARSPQLHDIGVLRDLVEGLCRGHQSFSQPRAQPNFLKSLQVGGSWY